MAPKLPNFLLASKTFDKKAKKKKKKYHRQACAWRDSRFSTTGINITNTSGGARNDGDRKDTSEAIYYNCNKKGHFVRNSSKPQKNWGSLKN